MKLSINMRKNSNKIEKYKTLLQDNNFMNHQNYTIINYKKSWKNIITSTIIFLIMFISSFFIDNYDLSGLLF